MTSIRLLADDLTGALDTAAEFVGLCGPFDVIWEDTPAASGSPSLAIDSGTRERSKAESVAIVGRLAPLLRDGTIAYKKVDSLLRGAWAAELGACLSTGHWASCVVAPAFDYQGRRTVDAQQYARTRGRRLASRRRQSAGPVATGWHRGAARQRRHAGARRRSGLRCRERPRSRSRRRDGAADARAGAVVRQWRAGRCTRAWPPRRCAFEIEAAGARACSARTRPPPHPSWMHAATPPLRSPRVREALVVQRKLADDGVALVKFSLAEGLSRADAAQRIARELTALITALDPPGTLIVAGGETLKAVCLALGAHALQVTGRIVPGLPRSTLQGGRWAGVDVISKSGAFGARELWRDLLRDNHLLKLESPT